MQLDIGESNYLFEVQFESGNPLNLGTTKLSSNQEKEKPTMIHQILRKEQTWLSHIAPPSTFLKIRK